MEDYLEELLENDPKQEEYEDDILFDDGCEM